MRYLSDVTGKSYDTVEELEKAEAVVKKEKEEKEAKLANISKEKKEAAMVVEKAESHLDEAYKNLETAEAKVKDLLREYNKKVEEILCPAEEEVKKAQAERYDAIRDFNKRFGAFTTTYTGAKAAEEMNRAMKAFNTIFDHFFF